MLYNYGLKACPFCKCEARVVSYRLSSRKKSYRYCVRCPKCNAHSDKWASRRKAIDSWNQGNIIRIVRGHWYVAMNQNR